MESSIPVGMGRGRGRGIISENKLQSVSELTNGQNCMEQVMKMKMEDEYEKEKAILPPLPELLPSSSAVGGESALVFNDEASWKEQVEMNQMQINTYQMKIQELQEIYENLYTDFEINKALMARFQFKCKEILTKPCEMMLKSLCFTLPNVPTALTTDHATDLDNQVPWFPIKELDPSQEFQNAQNVESLNCMKEFPVVTNGMQAEEMDGNDDVMDEMINEDAVDLEKKESETDDSTERNHLPKKLKTRGTPRRQELPNHKDAGASDIYFEDSSSTDDEKHLHKLQSEKILFRNQKWPKHNRKFEHKYAHSWLNKCVD